MSVDTPEKLSAAELAAARSWYTQCGNDNLVPAKYLGMVLRHVAALEAERAPGPVDREALGREALRIELDWRTLAGLNASAETLVFAWSCATQSDRVRLQAIAEHLHALGARSRDAEVAVARDCGQPVVCASAPGCARHWEERNGELAAQIARLTAERVDLDSAPDPSTMADDFYQKKTCGQGAIGGFADGVIAERQRIRARGPK